MKRCLLLPAGYIQGVIVPYLGCFSSHDLSGQINLQFLGHGLDINHEFPSKHSVDEATRTGYGTCLLLCSAGIN